MALTVEDGTIVAGAESYISVADASTYHTNRGNAAWAALASDTVREQCLRKATDYMIQAYTARWQGVRYVAETQALDWPREGVVVNGVEVDYDTVPTAVKNACAELALKAATETLNADLEQGVLSEQVGSISVSYDRTTPQSKRYKAIDAMLAPYLNSGGGCSVGLVRV
jgi:hypothetical protein